MFICSDSTFEVDPFASFFSDPMKDFEWRRVFFFFLVRDSRRLLYYQHHFWPKRWIADVTRFQIQTSCLDIRSPGLQLSAPV